MTIALPTFDALYDIGKSEIQSRNPELTDFNDGSNLDALTGMAAALANEGDRLTISYFAARFLDTAEGDDLDAVVADRFPAMDPRNEASAAVVPLVVTRGASTGVLEVPAGQSVRATVNGRSVTFTVDSAAYMAAAATTITVNATCSATGASGNIAAGTLTTFVGGLPGDSTATVTNAVRAAGGAVVESDDRFRDRARRYHGTLRRATVAALESAALTVPGVYFATVDESLMDPSDGGYVSVYVGDPDARANAALTAEVVTAIDLVRAAGVRVVVASSVREEFALAATLYVRTGSDLVAIQAAAVAAIGAYSDSLAPNSTFYLSRAESAAIGVADDVLGCSVTSPTTDQVPTLGYNALRVPAASLTLTITEV